MNKSKYIGKSLALSLALLSSLSISAQTAEKKLCDFESTDSYASVGVYDTLLSATALLRAMYVW